MFDQARPESQFLKPAPPKRISLPSSQRLNTILESNNPGAAASEQPHELSPRIQNARRSYLAHHGFPPLHGDEKPPPSYSQLSSSRGSGVDLSSARYSQSSRLDGGSAAGTGPFSRAKQNLTGRGGWKKLVIAAGVVLLVLIGLAVGLGVGLTQHKNGGNNGSAPGSSAGDSTASPGQSTSQAFPAGLWQFDVVLASTSTSCTANADTWSCFPYTTYDRSPTASQYSFNWNISRDRENELMISSSGNVFSLTFPATPLRLVGEGTAEERLTFSLLVPKQTQSTGSVSGNNDQAVCYFNQTMLAGTLYTGRSTAAGSSTMSQRWPGTSYIEQASPGGSGVPDCYRKQGNGVGAQITQGLAPQPASSRCSCVYESNNGTSNKV